LQVVQAEPLVQVRQVDEQAVQLTAPESKKPEMHLQFWVISLRVASTQELQVPVGLLQVWQL
jgi:hypothetical protein